MTAKVAESCWKHHSRTPSSDRDPNSRELSEEAAWRDTKSPLSVSVRLIRPIRSNGRYGSPERLGVILTRSEMRQ